MPSRSNNLKRPPTIRTLYRRGLHIQISGEIPPCPGHLVTPDRKRRHLCRKAGSHFKETRYSYDCVISVADNIYGPYGERYNAITGGGHNNLFQDRDGNWWATMFFNPRGAQAAEYETTCRPGLYRCFTKTESSLRTTVSKGNADFSRSLRSVEMTGKAPVSRYDRKTTAAGSIHKKRRTADRCCPPLFMYYEWILLHHTAHSACRHCRCGFLLRNICDSALGCQEHSCD